MNTKIEERKENILRGMRKYRQYFIEDGETPPYTEADVDECANLLHTFVAAVASSPEKSDLEWITAQVKALVISLNKLNDKLEGSLIETDQREGICQLIDNVLEAAGHNVNEDITEDWRDW